MAPAVFVDTGAWYALADPGDSFHAAAAGIYPRLLRRGVNLVTTNLVLAEAHALILHWMHRLAALQFLANTHPSSYLDIVYANASLHLAAEALLHRYTDQPFSLTDALSFVVMRERQINEAFTFDHHFQIAGFSILATPRA